MAYIPLLSLNPPPHSRQQRAMDTENKATAHFHALLSFFCVQSLTKEPSPDYFSLCVATTGEVWG